MKKDEDMSNSKMQSLMALIGEMKRLQATGLHGEGPDAMEVEIHAHKLDPQDVEKLEEATHQDLDGDNEQGESPEHQAMVLGHDDSDSDDSSDADSSNSPHPMDMSSDQDDQPEEDEDQHSEMQLPPGLMKLLMERMGK